MKDLNKKDLILNGSKKSEVGKDLKKCATNIDQHNSLFRNFSLDKNFGNNSKNSSILEDSLILNGDTKSIFKEDEKALKYTLTTRYMDDIDEFCDIQKVLVMKEANLNLDKLEDKKNPKKISENNVKSQQLEFINNNKIASIEINMNYNNNLFLRNSKTNSNIIDLVDCTLQQKSSMIDSSLKKDKENSANIENDDNKMKEIKQERLNEIKKQQTKGMQNTSNLIKNDIISSKSSNLSSCESLEFQNNLKDNKKNKKSSSIVKNSSNEKKSNKKKSKSSISVSSNSSSLSDLNNGVGVANKQKNNLIVEEKHDDSSNISSGSELEFNNNNIVKFESELYCLPTLERVVLPKEMEIFSKLNFTKNVTQDFSSLIKMNNFNNFNNIQAPKENPLQQLKIRRGKLLGKTLLVYASNNVNSQQILSTLDLKDCYLELGLKYKLTEKIENIPDTLYSFNLWNNQKQYSIYCIDEDQRNKWLEMIKKAIGSDLANNNYYILESVYKNKEKSLTVRKAKRKIDGKTLAIKCYLKNNSNVNCLNNVWREFSVINTLRHPYVIHIYDKVENSESISLILEFCEGGSLFDFLEKRKFIITEKQACKIIFQLCSVVSYLHLYNVIHKDLNLDNILMTDNSEKADIRLIGFCNSKFKGNNNQSEYNELINFCSPEILSGKEYGFESDIWSIGVISYILLSGIYPFDPSEKYKLINDIIFNEIQFPTNLWKYQSKESLFFVKNLLNKDPKKRMNFIEIFNFPWFYMWGDK